MHSNEFEEAFGNFLERVEYDKASNALFCVTRAAFQAGWLAAGGEPPVPQKVFELIRPDKDPRQAADEEAEPDGGEAQR